MRLTETINGVKTLIIEIDLGKISTKNSFFKLMIELFYLPEEMRNSYDSLNDYMRDLEWETEKSIIIKIKNSDRLKLKDETLYNDVSNCFQFYSEYWEKSTNKSVVLEFY